MKYELLALKDKTPNLGGAAAETPDNWRAAAADGWALVSVSTMGNGERVGYFQREIPAAIPKTDASASHREALQLPQKGKFKR